MQHSKLLTQDAHASIEYHLGFDERFYHVLNVIFYFVTFLTFLTFLFLLRGFFTSTLPPESGLSSDNMMLVPATRPSAQLATVRSHAVAAATACGTAKTGNKGMSPAAVH